MQSFPLRDEVDRLNSRRTALVCRSLREETIYPLPKFVEAELPHRNFLDYLLPSERSILQTNNAEYMLIKKRQSKYFAGQAELDVFLQDSFSSSSHNEEFPPASEELFFNDQDLEHLGQYHRLTSDCASQPPLTRMQIRLLKSLARFTIHPADNPTVAAVKKHHRRELIRGHCKWLKRKRYARTYKRFTKTRAKKLDVGAEAAELREHEIRDKDLRRTDGVYCKDMLTARAEAIRSKFELYAVDPEFRKEYKKRVYYNVNLDVPVSDVEASAVADVVERVDKMVLPAIAAEDGQAEVVPAKDEKKVQFPDTSEHLPQTHQQLDSKARWLALDKKYFEQFRQEAFQCYLDETGIDLAKRVHQSMCRSGNSRE